MRVAIIGAGLAGLTAALVLRRAGLAPVVYDKGRGPGGRLATRRAEGGLQFDHRAQYLSARTAGFAEFLREAEAAGAAGRWTIGDQGEKVVGHPGMNGIAKFLARGVDLRQGVEVASIERAAGGWTVAGKTYDRILCTVPAPQAVRLIGQRHPLAEALRGVVMDPALTLMLALPSRSERPFVARRELGDDIAWLALDNDRHARPGPDCWVAQAGPDWSKAHLEREREQIAALMLPLVCTRLGVNSAKAIHVSAHRWRYAQATRPLGQSYLTDGESLFLGGDWALSARAEGAWQSGRGAAGADGAATSGEQGGESVSDRPGPRPLAIPAGRFSRFARLGGLTGGIAGNVVLQALGEAGRGMRPDLRRLLMTPTNVRRLADELARMRGAAMKVGQLLSMDAGEVLPSELAEILARLRDQAHVMPPAQLKKVLTRGWGPDWLRSFRRFEVQPFAAASIGQVHRAVLGDGREVAIKVQYPGIARSIDSDVSNVGALVRVSGLVPKGFDLAPYLDEARRQLHAETDYAREGAQLRRFGTLLADSDSFRMPELHADWSTPEILTMSYLDGRAIESAAAAPPGERNRIMSALVDLTLREVFEFGATQSDPNFANYRYDPDTGCILLLDFGATRDLDPGLTERYRRLLRAGLAGDPEAVRRAARALHLIGGGGAGDDSVLAMIHTVSDAVRQNDRFDFGDQAFLDRLRTHGMALTEAGHVPAGLPMDLLYLQRKFGGMFLLGRRLRAFLPTNALLKRYLR